MIHRFWSGISGSKNFFLDLEIIFSSRLDGRRPTAAGATFGRVEAAGKEASGLNRGPAASKL